MFTILLFSQISGALSGVSGAIQAYPLIKRNCVRFIFMVGAQIPDNKGRAYLSPGFSFAHFLLGIELDFSSSPSRKHRSEKGWGP